MTSIMNRSFADHMGFNWPKEWACVVDGKPVTYAELLETRRRRQHERLARIREIGAQRRAVRVIVRHFGDWLLGGWHPYIDGVGFSHWVRRSDRLFDQLVRRFPVTEFSHRWCEAFAHRYRRGTQEGQPVGIVYCWATVHGERVEELLEIIEPRVESAIRNPQSKVS